MTSPDCPHRPARRTRRRARVVVAGAVAALVLAGCGADSETATDPEILLPSDPTAEPGTDPSTDPIAGGIEHPSGADDVLVRVEVGGGFVPVEVARTQQPVLLLTGDGRLFVQPEDAAPTRMIEMQVAQVGEEQVQTLLALAAGAGLLAEAPDYATAGGPQVADAPTTTVTLRAAGGTWVHEAYALGLGGSTEERRALEDFVDGATDAVSGLDFSAYAPDRLELFVEPTDLSREVVPWPADGVVLADVAGCEVVPADDLGESLGRTGLTTSYRQAGELYSVAATQVLPGDTPCAS